MSRFFAKGRPRRVPGTMNKTEAVYAARLDVLHRAGEIARYGFEAFKLRLADNTFYTPDFYVLRTNGEIELVEVKGSWHAPYQEDSRVKIKVAAARYPEFHFCSVSPVAKNKGGGWLREEF